MDWYNTGTAAKKGGHIGSGAGGDVNESLGTITRQAYIKSHKVLGAVDPLISLWGTNPPEIIQQQKKVLFTRVLVSALFIMMKNWKL